MGLVSFKTKPRLRRPLRLLGERSPLDLLDSLTGIQLVDDILGRIEYGGFS
ncbi:MbcA/ParS/Xre antitoxin family protein [Fibrella rubiginis]|uniref:MbcA/ParS/Xre antitoxin family protein n=1 Tax=Fibrella rubiginis TaxID=2817060 RepID=UPI001E61652D|nr:MbcA/ParS/Xre antitoxin family protein [Fibrella rubiginis]